MRERLPLAVHPLDPGVVFATQRTDDVAPGAQAGEIADRGGGLGRCAIEPVIDDLPQSVEFGLHVVRGAGWDVALDARDLPVCAGMPRFIVRVHDVARATELRIVVEVRARADTTSAIPAHAQA